MFFFSLQRHPSENQKPYLRSVRHGLHKEERRHLFSIPDEDVNNVPPSKQTGIRPLGISIVLSATHNTFP